MNSSKTEHAPNTSRSLAEEYFENDPKWMRVIARALEAKILHSKRLDSQLSRELSSVDTELDPRLDGIVQKLICKDPTAVKDIEELSLEEEVTRRFESTFYTHSASEIRNADLEIRDEVQFSKVLASKVLKSAGIRYFYAARALSLNGFSNEPPEDYLSVMQLLAKISGPEAAKSDLARLLADGLIGKKTPTWLEVEVRDDVKAKVGVLTRKYTRVSSMEVDASNPDESKITLIFVSEGGGSKEVSRQSKLTKPKLKFAPIKQNILGFFGRHQKSNDNVNSKFSSHGLKSNSAVTITGVCSFQENKFVCTGENLERQNKVLTY